MFKDQNLVIFFTEAFESQPKWVPRNIYTLCSERSVDYKGAIRAFTVLYSNSMSRRGSLYNVPPIYHIPSCECNEVVSAFLLFCRRGDFVLQAVFSGCWKFKRKEKLNKIEILLFLYDINVFLFLIQNH